VLKPSFCRVLDRVQAPEEDPASRLTSTHNTSNDMQVRYSPAPPAALKALNMQLHTTQHAQLLLSTNNCPVTPYVCQMCWPFWQHAMLMTLQCQQNPMHYVVVALAGPAGGISSRTQVQRTSLHLRASSTL